MKKITAGLILALALTTGFTCSKNTPPEMNKTEQAPPPAQDQMGAPANTEGAQPGTPGAAPAPTGTETTQPSTLPSAEPATPAPGTAPTGH
jgi:hypothetical protein